MVTWSEIKTGEIQYTRLDSEFYHPKYLDEDALWTRIRKTIPVKPLGRFVACPIRTGHTPKDRDLRQGEDTVIFVKTDTLREGRIEYDQCAVLPRRCIRSSDLIPSGAVVVTIIGATYEIVGRAAIRLPEDPPCVTNQNVAVIQTTGAIDPHFLMVFLNTRFGRDQIWRHARQTEQVNMNCREIERVLIPQLSTPFQVAVAQLVRQSVASLQRATALYVEAELSLASFLNLKKLNVSHPLGYESLLSNITSARRWDARFHSPVYVDLKRLLVDANAVSLGALASLQKGVEVGSEAYRSEGVLFVRVSTLTAMGLRVGSSERFISDSLYRQLRTVYEPVVGEVLLSKDGTPGIACVVESPIKGVVSGGIVKLSPKPEVNPYYLAAVLNSRACQIQIDQEASGAVIMHWKPDKIRALAIPRLAPEIEDSIAAKVKEALQTRRQSETLLEQAKCQVEQLIEKEAKV